MLVKDLWGHAGGGGGGSPEEKNRSVPVVVLSTTTSMTQFNTDKHCCFINNNEYDTI